MTKHNSRIDAKQFTKLAILTTTNANRNNNSQWNCLNKKNIYIYTHMHTPNLHSPFSFTIISSRPPITGHPVYTTVTRDCHTQRFFEPRWNSINSPVKKKNVLGRTIFRGRNCAIQKAPYQFSSGIPFPCSACLQTRSHISWNILYTHTGHPGRRCVYIYLSGRVIVLDNGTRCARNGLSWYIIALFLATGGSAVSINRLPSRRHQLQTLRTPLRRGTVHHCAISSRDPAVPRENARQMARRGAITKPDEPWRALAAERRESWWISLRAARKRVRAAARGAIGDEWTR